MNKKADSLYSVSIKNAAQVVVRFVLGILNVKIIAVFVGPAGMAIYSHFQNFLQIGVNVASGGINSGVVKYISQYREDDDQQRKIIGTSVLLVVSLSLVFGLLLALFPKLISQVIFDTKEYSEILKYVIIYFLSGALLNLIISLLNGFQRLKSFIVVSLLLNICSFCIAIVSVYYWGLKGLLFGQVFVNVLPLGVGLFFIKDKLKLGDLRFDQQSFRKLSSFSLMALVSGVLSPVALIIVRKIISINLSMDQAGLWDGVNKISTNYIMLVTMSFGYYFLPTFSGLKQKIAIRKEVEKSIKFLLIILVPAGVILYLSRYLIIKLLFSDEFYQITDIIHWQLLGDAVKIVSWVLGMLLIAKAKVKAFIISEIISIAFYILLVYFLTQLMGIEGSTLAYLLENIFYLLVVSYWYYYFWFK